MSNWTSCRRPRWILEEVGVRFPSEKALALLAGRRSHRPRHPDRELPRDLVFKAMKTVPRYFPWARATRPSTCTSKRGLPTSPPTAAASRRSTSRPVPAPPFAQGRRRADGRVCRLPLRPSPSTGRWSAPRITAGPRRCTRWTPPGTTRSSTSRAKRSWVKPGALCRRDGDRHRRAARRSCAAARRSRWWCAPSPRWCRIKDGIEGALVLAEAGVPVGFLAMPTLGTTAPATLAGALARGRRRDHQRHRADAAGCSRARRSSTR